MRLTNRLRRLEEQVPDAGCPACRDRRGRLVMVTSRRQSDGTTTRVDAWPAPCEQCWKLPEFIVEVVETVVESDEDVARLANEGRPGVAAARLRERDQP